MTAAVERMRVAIIGPGRISDLHAIEYVNSEHTDIVAVKAFFQGLLVFQVRTLPAAPLLALHLTLVASLM